jgi:4-hydroxy-3-polyprenylbenzoate decarboxylase
MSPLVLAMTGASGAIYAVRLVQVLIAAGRHIHFTCSPAAAEVCEHELGLRLNLEAFDADVVLHPDRHAAADGPWRHLRLPPLPPPPPGTVPGSLVYHHYRDFRAGIASGSFLTDGMVVCPCSGGTLAGIATGQSQNLIHRAADVHLKERRKLILVPRETPLSSITLANLKTLADLGVVILPASPGFYHGPRGLHDLVDFVVARICDQLRVPHMLMQRWGA